MSDNSKEHLANERTFLAWVRTSLGIMAFGFVIERFGIFIHQILLHNHDSNPSPSPVTSHFGIALVVIGVLLTFAAFFNFKKITKQIENNQYQPSFTIYLILTLLILLIGALLLFYLRLVGASE